MFVTTLTVSHVLGKTWRLNAPLVYKGKRDYYVIKAGFETDFASIPKPIAWLLDSSGGNSEAAVLHDAVWRESQEPKDVRRIDPWNADGLFRRALRETGMPALTRGLMWWGVRTNAVVHGRFGIDGPSLPIKLLQLVGGFLLGVITVLPVTIVAAIGLVAYWVFNWIAAAVWTIFERSHGMPTNWPWLPFTPKKVAALIFAATAAPTMSLVVVPIWQSAEVKTAEAVALENLLLARGDTPLTNAEIDALSDRSQAETPLAVQKAWELP